MSLKCSLLGHAFDDGEVEREREEQGSEVVITIRETETCTRCGTERTVSENKEVTTLETPSDIVGDELADAEAEAEASAETTATERATNATGGTDAAAGAAAAGTAEVASSSAADEPTSEPDPGSTPEDTEVGSTPGDTEVGSTPEPATASDPDPDEDDGVILDADDDDDDERAPGEWPEADDEAADAGDDEAADAVPEWPQEDDDGDEEDWAPETDSQAPTEVEPTSTAVTVPEGSFHCPECGFSTPVEDSSLRAGDFCPECHRGSLEHRS